MQSTHIIKKVPIRRTPRVIQLEGIFDVAPSADSKSEWSVNMPIHEKDWKIGLIVGPSGSGKTTIAKEIFKANIIEGYAWKEDGSIIDAFPKSISINEITKVLSSVGFSSPPSWLRPFSCLSNGEQFRVTMARALFDERKLIVMDEFTSVVDRTVARIGSHAIAKTIRKAIDKQFVALSCHYDIIDWLQPDWIYQPHLNAFEWRCLQCRPRIEMEVYRTSTQAWEIFKKHHYLSGEINKAARCFIGTIEGQPAAFCAVLHFPHPKAKNVKRCHRLVCLPDFQGCGIGTKMNNFIGSVYKSAGFSYHITTSTPALTRSQGKNWTTIRRSGIASRSTKKNASPAGTARKTVSVGRFTTSFKYIGQASDRECLAILD